MDENFMLMSRDVAYVFARGFVVLCRDTCCWVSMVSRFRFLVWEPFLCSPHFQPTRWRTGLLPFRQQMSLDKLTANLQVRVVYLFQCGLSSTLIFSPVRAMSHCLTQSLPTYPYFMRCYVPADDEFGRGGGGQPHSLARGSFEAPKPE